MVSLFLSNGGNITCLSFPSVGNGIPGIILRFLFLCTHMSRVPIFVAFQILILSATILICNYPPVSFMFLRGHSLVIGKAGDMPPFLPIIFFAQKKIVKTDLFAFDAKTRQWIGFPLFYRSRPFVTHYPNPSPLNLLGGIFEPRGSVSWSPPISYHSLSRSLSCVMFSIRGISFTRLPHQWLHTSKNEETKP